MKQKEEYEGEGEERKREGKEEGLGRLFLLGQSHLDCELRRRGEASYCI